MSCKFYKKIDGITVKGQFHPEMDSVEVTLDYYDRNLDVFPVLDQFLTETNRTYPFSYIPRHQTEPAARGQLIFDRADSGQMRLILELTVPVEETVIFNPGETGSEGPVQPVPGEPVELPWLSREESRC